MQRFQEQLFLGLGAVVLLTAFLSYGLNLKWDPAASVQYAHYLLGHTAQLKVSQAAFVWGDPPLYPWLLALGARLGLPLLTWASWLNGTCYAATVVCFYHLLKGWSVERSAAISWTLALLLNPVFVDHHLTLTSTPVFLFLLTATFALLSSKRQMVAALVAGLLPLARLVGLWCAPFFVLAQGRQVPWLRRLASGALFFLPWLIFLYFGEQQIKAATEWRSVETFNWERFKRSMEEIFFSEHAFSRVFLVSFLACLVVHVVRERRGSWSPARLVALGAAMLSYIGLHVALFAFFDHEVELDLKRSAPLILLGLACVALVPRSQRLAQLLVLFNFWGLGVMALQLHRQGPYGQEWELQHSAVRERIAQLPTASVLNNKPVLFYMHFGSYGVRAPEAFPGWEEHTRRILLSPQVRYFVDYPVHRSKFRLTPPQLHSIVPLELVAEDRYLRLYRIGRD